METSEDARRNLRAARLLGGCGVPSGVLGFAIAGFSDPLHPAGRTLIVLPVFPIENAIVLGAGMALLWLASRSRVAR